MRFEVLVSYKPEVLDTEARAIKETLQRHGHKALQDVKFSKRYILDLEGAGIDEARRIAEAFLANPVSEQFEIRPI